MFRSAVLLHVYYLDLWPEIAGLLHRLDALPWVLYVNVVEGVAPPGWAESVKQEFAHANVLVSPNRGMDIGGTLNLLRQVDLNEFDLILKLHTKRCDFNPSLGTRWRRDLLEGCLDQPEKVMSLFENNPGVSMIGSRRWIRRCEDHFADKCKGLGQERGLSEPAGDRLFFAGSMFWARVNVFHRFKAMDFSQSDFPSGYQRDGGLAHVLERMFGWCGQLEGQLLGRETA